jgi:hypothetical protein
MPPKSRIEERAFQAALRSLRIDELPLLDSSTSTGDIWSRLCIQMGKPNNIENQRACYDVWKRKKYNSHDIVSRILLVCILKFDLMCVISILHCYCYRKHNNLPTSLPYKILLLKKTYAAMEQLLV